MVDCRPAAAGAGHELHPAPNGAQTDNHHNQGASGDMGGGGGAGGGGAGVGGVALSSPAARASTPANNTAINTYSGNMSMPNLPAASMGYPVNMGVSGVGCGPYMCGVKPAVGGGGHVMWMSPHSPPPHAPHAPPPPPPTVNPHVFKSVQANGADLPMNDIPTLRYYFNLGVECMWAAYGPPPPHRHYSHRDIAQDMQQMSLNERGAGMEAHKHKPHDNKPPLNNKGNGQRPLLGPRFKRGNNQDGNQNNNHNQNKGHNNNMGNKGPNNRRNSHPEGRSLPPQYSGGGGAEGGEVGAVVEAPQMLTLPYIPYPPPLYPIPYYPVESDPAMMGMMGGMGYMGYEEGAEYGPLQPYYPPPHYPPPHHQPHHNEHK